MLNESLELWNGRFHFVVQERNPPILLSKYEFWYWQIPHRFILKQWSRRLVVYIPRASLEGDVVSSLIYNI